MQMIVSFLIEGHSKAIIGFQSDSVNRHLFSASLDSTLKVRTFFTIGETRSTDAKIDMGYCVWRFKALNRTPRTSISYGKSYRDRDYWCRLR
jgi:hypothetical protein